MRTVNMFWFFLSILWFVALNISIYQLGSSMISLVSWDLSSLSGSMSVNMVSNSWSWMFIFVVSFISSLIMIYTKSYIGGEEIKRFSWILLSFICSMIMLIMMPELPMTLLGWDGLGLSSFLLVCYYSNSDSRGSALITALTNRIGDVMLLGSIAFLMVDHYLSGLMLIIAALTKSAQVPFSSWLPAAMAAPTPVSALVHSSTLVTAGVYLIFNYSGFFSIGCLWVMMVISSITLICSSVCAVFETDLKKLIALSTMSQVSLMLLSFSIGLKELAMMHLFIHAIFKATMFISAGFVISQQKTQDIRQISGLGFSKLEFFLLGAMIFNLQGWPFLAASMSKEAIIWESISSPGSNLINFVLLISVMLTSVYSSRLLFMISSNLSSSKVLFSSGISFSWLYCGFFYLLSILIGPMIVNLGLKNWGFICWSTSSFLSLSVALIFLGWVLGYLFSSKEVTSKFNLNFFSSLWFQDQMSFKAPSWGMVMSHKLEKVLDQGWIEIIPQSSLLEKLTSQLFEFNFSSIRISLFMGALVILICIMLV